MALWKKSDKKIKDENEIKLKIRNIKYVVGLLIKMRHWWIIKYISDIKYKNMTWNNGIMHWNVKIKVTKMDDKLGKCIH